MRQGRSKHHHFVPIALQKRFQCEQKKIWFAERNEFGQFPFVEKRNHRSVFWKKNYNTTLENGKPSDRLETGFWGDIDNHLGELLPEIEDALDKDTIPLFTGKPRDSVCRVFTALMIRSPDFMPNCDPLKMGNEAADQVIKTGIRLSESEIDFINSPLRKIQNGRHIMAMSRVTEPTNAITALQNYEVRFVRPERRSAFILGSSMVYRCGNSGNTHLDNPNTELWFPISPRTVVVLLRPHPETPHLVEFPKMAVRKFNEYVCRSSSKVGSHSEKLLRSLINACPS